MYYFYAERVRDDKPVRTQSWLSPPLTGHDWQIMTYLRDRMCVWRKGDELVANWAWRKKRVENYQIAFIDAKTYSLCTLVNRYRTPVNYLEAVRCGKVLVFVLGRSRSGLMDGVRASSENPVNLTASHQAWFWELIHHILHVVVG